MLKIEDGRLSFYQWDLNQRLVIDNPSIIEVHYTNALTSPALVCEVYAENGIRYANVPNILLQTDWTIKVYGCCDEYVLEADTFIVNTKEKPADYVYTETEIKTFSDLEKRIEYLEENGVGGSGAVSSVNGKTGDVVLTAADVRAATYSEIEDYYDSLKVFIDANSTAIEDLSTELDNYYTKEETDNAITQALNSLIDGDEVSY